MNEQNPNDEPFDAAAALEAARRAVDAVFAEGVRDQVDGAFTTEIQANAVQGVIDDTRELLGGDERLAMPPPQASAQNPTLPVDGITSQRIGDGGVTEYVQGMPTDPGGFAAARQEYAQQLPQVPQSPVGPVAPGPGQIVSGRHESVRPL